MSEEKPRMTYGMWLKLKSYRKRSFLDRCSLQAKFAKAQLIIAPKGRNGRSMSAALLAQHGIVAPRKEGA